jgi:toxin-antitoxin system PIN domain toxin
MQLVDVNVLVYAHRGDAPNHSEFSRWLEALINSDQAYGMADPVLTGSLRIGTHPSIFNPPSDLSSSSAFVNEVRDQPNCVHITPGARHWDIFTRLCTVAGTKGNLVPDAYLAALAIESGNNWVTTDRDYSRFPGLEWRHPLAV